MPPSEESPQMSPSCETCGHPYQPGACTQATAANSTGAAAAVAPGVIERLQAMMHPGEPFLKPPKPVTDMNPEERHCEAKSVAKWAARYERRARQLRARERELLGEGDTSAAQDVKTVEAATDAPVAPFSSVPPVSAVASTPEGGHQEQQTCSEEEEEKKKKKNTDVGDKKVDI